MTVVYLKPSFKKEKKYMVLVDGKTIHFGARGMSDFTKHKDVERMKRYSERHKRGGETWNKSGIKTAGFWSKWLLWNKPTIAASKKSISSKYGVVFKSGWPSKSKNSKSSKMGSKRKSRKSKRKSRKSKRKSRKSKRKSRKSKSKSRRSKRKSRKSKRK
jgi:hypothetical protein